MVSAWMELTFFGLPLSDVCEIGRFNLRNLQHTIIRLNKDFIKDTILKVVDVHRPIVHYDSYCF